MVKADFVTGLIFLALGVAALVESLRMPRFEALGVNPFSVPGLVPGLLGAVIAGLGAVLALRAARRGGWRFTSGFTIAGEANVRLATAFVLTFGYAAGLVGQLPFWLATGVFVFLFITLFEWRDSKRKVRVLVIAAVEAGIVATVVTLVFRDLFLVTLP